MSGDIGIGTILGGGAEKDAIHIAVAPMIAAHLLSPGQHVGLMDSVRAGKSEHPVGIVDPFLKEAVHPGERFYLFMYPGSITSLRHEWIHPAFVGAALTPESASHRWIEELATELDQTPSRLMEAAQIWISTQDYTYDNAETYKKVNPAKWELFWAHYEIVTGTVVADKKATFFTCSC